jgi:subtilisin family serine protease
LHHKKLLPNDAWFPSQWHLRNVGQSGGTFGMDINVVTVWDAWRGSGVTIGVVDGGVQAAHPDLAPNFDADLSVNFNASTFDPVRDTHGTPVAGIIGARGNNGLGVAGVAFEARLADLRLIADAETDEQDAAAMLHRNDALAVKNNSWGAYDGDGRLEGPGPLMTDALAQGTTSGRGGQGVIYTFAAGNGKTYGENANYDGFANSVRVIAVGALNDQGLAASYSEPGACVAVVAPSRGSSSTCSDRPGITTTDLLGYNGRNPGGSCEPWDRDYTSTFGGTSAATPIVSGVAALLLQANPALGWRDVKEILMRSATKVVVTDADWQTNRAGLAHHHQYGAGLVNAGAALLLANQWLNLGQMQVVTLLATNLNRPVPDNSPPGVSVSFTVTNQGFRVEHAALTVTLPHTKHGDLAINLTSSCGTTSRLAEPHNSSGVGYYDWTLTSVRHWGEPAAGTWTVNLADLVPSNTGTLQELQLTLYGSVPSARLSAEWVDGNFRVTLHAAAPGWSYALETSSSLTAWSQVAVLNPGPDGNASYTYAGSATGLKFYRARHLP